MGLSETEPPVVPTIEPGPRQERRIQRTALAVYGAMTLIGVLEASTTQAVVDSILAVVVVVVSTSLAIVIAHAWSSVVAHRLVQGRQLSRERIGDELWFAGSFFVPAAIALASLVVFGIPENHLEAITNAQFALLIFLFVIGVVGARRGGKGWWKSIGWGSIDVLVGFLVMMLKEVLHLFGH